MQALSHMFKLGRVRPTGGNRQNKVLASFGCEVGSFLCGLYLVEASYARSDELAGGACVKKNCLHGQFPPVGRVCLGSSLCMGLRIMYPMRRYSPATCQYREDVRKDDLQMRVFM